MKVINKTSFVPDAEISKWMQIQAVVTPFRKANVWGEASLSQSHSVPTPKPASLYLLYSETSYFISLSHTHTHILQTLTEQYHMSVSCYLKCYSEYYNVILFKIDGKPMGTLSYDSYYIRGKSKIHRRSA